MLKIIRSLKDLNFRQLADVYIQSCQERGSVHYSGQTAQQQLLSEQDLYGEVKCFFADKNALREGETPIDCFKRRMTNDSGSYLFFLPTKSL